MNNGVKSSYMDISSLLQLLLLVELFINYSFTCKWLSLTNDIIISIAEGFPPFPNETIMFYVFVWIGQINFLLFV